MKNRNKYTNKKHYTTKYIAPSPRVGLHTRTIPEIIKYDGGMHGGPSPFGVVAGWFVGG
jgi:hypothetical protein